MIERWRRIEELFHRAAETEPSARSDFLDSACGDDAELRREVESLLAGQGASGFMDTPAIEGMARELAGDATPLETGRTFGSYTIRSLIGKGGMGEVYRAYDSKLGREVAVKVLPGSLALDPDRVRRFDREARLLATVNHPNVATIHGLEESGGQQFLVLELVEGETLTDRLEGSALPAREALGLAHQIAEGLEAAHAKGIIHRDLKPANIKITPEGHAKILDFGLARAMAADASDADVTQERGFQVAHTGASQLAGTAAYMSPEQVRGEAIDRRTDIWAFGAVLYEMLTGTAPFGGPTEDDSRTRVLEETPDFARLPGETPALVRRLLRRALEKNPRQRLQHIGDARLDLEDALAGPVPLAPPGSRTTRRWHGARFVGGLLLILPAAALGAWLALRVLPQSPPAVTRLSIGPLPSPGPLLTGTPSLNISADGMWIAYEAGGRISSRAMARDDFTAIASGWQPFFSPDGRWVAFFESNGLNKVSTEGGSPVAIARMAFTTGAAGRTVGGTWGQDGTIIFATSLGLFRIPDDGSAGPQLLIEPPDGQTYAWPHFLPGDRWVLFSRITGSTTEAADIVLLDLESLATRTIQSGGVGAQFLSAGFLAYSTGGHIAAVGFDPDAGRVIGSPVVFPDIGLRVGQYLRAGFAVSRSGTLLHLPAGDASGDTRAASQFEWVDASGNEQPIPGLPPGRISYARVSPSGDQLALDVSEPNLNARRIWTLDLERNVASRVTGMNVGGSSFEDLLPQWHPDGDRIFFASNRTGSFQVYSVAADGSGTERLLIGHPDVQMPYRIDRQHRMLFFRGPFEAADSGMIDVDDPGREPTWVLSQPWGEVNASLSRDGRWIAFESNESDESGGRFEVYVRPFPNVNDGRVQVSSGGGRQPLWSPINPRTLHYRRPDGAMMAVSFESAEQFRVVGVRELFPGDRFGPVSSSGWTYDISPVDGRFLLSRLRDTPPAGGNLLRVTLNWIEELEVLLPPP